MGKIKVDPAVLAAAAKISAIAVASSAPDVTAHHLFRVRDGKVELLSSNRSVFMSVDVAGAEVEGDVEPFTFEARRLAALLDSVGGKSSMSFEPGQGGSIQVETGRGKNIFQGLDPSTFPLWDEELAQALPNAVGIKTARLRAALADAAPYVYGDEAKARQLCVAEVRNGVVFATDQRSMYRTWLEGDPALSFRINGRDLRAVVSALSHAKGDDLQVCTHPKVTFFVAGGVTIGEMLVDVKFPELPTKPGVREGNLDAGAERWKFFVEDYREVAGLLASAARFEDDRLTFRRENNTLQLSMKTAGGKVTQIPLALHDATFEVGTEFPRPDMGRKSFVLSKEYFDNLVKVAGGTQFQMDVTYRAPAAKPDGSKPATGSGSVSARMVNADKDVTIIALPWVTAETA